MSSPYRNRERRAAAMRFLSITIASLLAVSANDALAQQTTLPDADSGPNVVAVTGLFPNGGAPPMPDKIGRSFEGNKAAIADGKQLFGQMNCSGCHFNGGGGMGPALMSGYWRYGGNIDQIYESIAQGRPNGMPSWQFSLQPEQIWMLAAYVKSLSVPAPDSPSRTVSTGAGARP
jgi:cytochrome c oxidase cbb3-type subunit III